MKKIFTLFIWLLIGTLHAQFQDSFTDGDFTNNPTWIGDTDSFEINLAKQLHLNAPSNTEESYIVTATNAAVDGYWEFYVDLDFNPSSSNKAYIYLISDQSDLKNGLNGYYVLVGNTSDEVSLYKQTGTSKTEIIDGIDGTVATTPKVKIKVTRDLLGNFELFTDTSLNFNNPISEGTVFDNEYMQSSYFGFRCDYTSTRSDKFIFDSIDVTAQEFIDIFPPVVTNSSIINLNTLEVSFSEDLNVNSVQNVANYSINNGIGNPITAVYNNLSKAVTLNYSSSFQAQTNYTLTINNIEDLNTNSLDTVISFQVANAYAFETIIFNEILADETPSFGLPTFEFIELKNLQNDTLFTEGWFLSDLTDTTYFNTDTILPNEYIIVGKTTAETFYEGFGKTFGLTSFVSLNKSEEKLTLYNKYGNVIDSLHYYDDWFAESLAPNGTDKVDGGWSLERWKDDFSCSPSLNWIPSEATIGGTPGQENSIVNLSINSLEPEISNAFFINDSTIQVVYDQEVTNGLDENNYSIGLNDVANAINIVSITKINSTTFNIEIADLYSEENTYTVSITDIENCYSLSQNASNFTIFYIKKPEIGDLIINEILFNPFSEAADYIEIYNTTNAALDLKSLSFIEYHLDYEDSITDYSTPFANTFVIPPKAYFTFSEDTQSVFLNYIVDKPEWLFQQNIPNYANNEGKVALQYDDSLILDELHYYSRWNFELLDSEDGVSLERISAEAITQDKDNWSSAAKSIGFGTPTARNSQSYLEIENDDLITVSPEVFTPNQDGDKDYTLINYKIDQAGFVANVAIYDVVGRKIKDIVLNETISTEGFWKWDGTNYNSEKAKVGIYIILIDLFDLEGKKKHFKEKVVLGTTF